MGVLSPLKKEKACGYLQWQHRKEILIENIRNKWTEVILYKLFESSQLSIQTWNNYSFILSLFALFGKQSVQKVGLNKLTPRLNANKLIYETLLSVKEMLLAIQTASNPLNISAAKIISVHKLCDYDVQIKMTSDYKFIWSSQMPQKVQGSQQYI